MGSLRCSCPFLEHGSCAERWVAPHCSLLWEKRPGQGSCTCAFQGTGVGRPSTFWCPACVVDSLGAFVWGPRPTPRGSSVVALCVCCVALMAASLLQGSSGLCPPRAAPAEDAERPGEHAAGAGHAHHHQVGPCLLWDVFCVHRRTVLWDHSTKPGVSFPSSACRASGVGIFLEQNC